MLQVPEESDEYRKIERKSALALSTIESIFPERLESTIEYLLDTSTQSVEDIKFSLHDLADAIQWPEGVVRGRWEQTANSAAECQEKVIHFMNNGFWPLVDKVK